MYGGDYFYCYRSWYYRKYQFNLSTCEHPYNIKNVVTVFLGFKKDENATEIRPLNWECERCSTEGGPLLKSVLFSGFILLLPSFFYTKRDTDSKIVPHKRSSGV